MAITQKDRRWMSLAKKKMANSKHSYYRFAAVICKGGRLIKIGFNTHGRAPEFARFPIDRSLHAEVAAILMLSKKETKNSTIYVAAVSAANNTVLTRPCNDCYRILCKAGIRKIIYHDKSGTLYEEKI